MSRDHCQNVVVCALQVTTTKVAERNNVRLHFICSFNFSLFSASTTKYGLYRCHELLDRGMQCSPLDLPQPVLKKWFHYFGSE